MTPRGYIEKRGRGWWLRMPLRPVDGRKCQVRIFLGLCRDLRTRAAARETANAWLARLQTAPVNSGPTIIVAEVLERFLRHIGPGLRASSLVRYKRLLRVYAIPALGSMQVSQVDTARVRQLFADLAARGLSASTLIGLRGVLLRALDDAREDGFPVPELPARRIKISAAAAPPREIRPVNAYDISRIVAAAPWPDKAMWGLLAHMGLRVSEMLAMRWPDIDFRAHALTVAQACVNGKIQMPKTKSSIATLPMSQPLEALLAEYRRIWPHNDRLLLFASRTGSPLLAGNIRVRRLHPLLERLNLKQRGFHFFRHSLPRILFAAGVSPDIVRRLMRHASLAQTEGYTHANLGDLRRALDAASERLTGRAESAHPMSKNDQVGSIAQSGGDKSAVG